MDINRNGNRDGNRNSSAGWGDASQGRQQYWNNGADLGGRHQGHQQQNRNNSGSRNSNNASGWGGPNQGQLQDRNYNNSNHNGNTSNGGQNRPQLSPCRNCGNPGHREANCWSNMARGPINNGNNNEGNNRQQLTPCRHCGKLGHRDETCWNLTGGPNKRNNRGNQRQNPQHPFNNAAGLTQSNENNLNGQQIWGDNAQAPIEHDVEMADLENLDGDVIMMEVPEPPSPAPPEGFGIPTIVLMLLEHLPQTAAVKISPSSPYRLQNGTISRRFVEVEYNDWYMSGHC